MPSKPRQSSFTPRDLEIETLDLEPVRIARGKTESWKLVMRATVTVTTADGRKFGTRAAVVRIPVFQASQPRGRATAAGAAGRRGKARAR